MDDDVSRIVLLSCSFKHKLWAILSSDETVADPNTDLQFLFIIRKYLLQSRNLSRYAVVLATRDDLHARGDGLYVIGGQQLTLNSSGNSAYPSPVPTKTRMARYVGSVPNHSRCAMHAKGLISSAVETDTFKIGSRTMIFDFSDDDPAEAKHFAAYRKLIELFHAGQVQTNPYFILKSACHEHYGFSSSKNIPYIILENSDIVIPGVISCDADEGTSLHPLPSLRASRRSC